MMLDNYSFKNRYLLSLSTAPTGMDNKRFLRYHKSHPWALPEPPESRLSFFIVCNIFSSSGSDYAYFYNHVSATNTTAADLTDTGIFLLSYTGSHSRRQETSLSFSVTLRLFEMGGAGSTYGEEVYTGYWWKNLTEREHLERPGRR